MSFENVCRIRRPYADCRNQQNVRAWYNTLLLEIGDLHESIENLEEKLDFEDSDMPLTDQMTLDICNGLVSIKGYISQAQNMVSRIDEEFMKEYPED